jgi:hypothetical protein
MSNTERLRICTCDKGRKYNAYGIVTKGRMLVGAVSSLVVLGGFMYVALENKQILLLSAMIGLVVVAALLIALRNILMGHKMLCSLRMAGISLLCIATAGPAWAS